MATLFRWACPGLGAVANLISAGTPVPNNDPCDPLVETYLWNLHGGTISQFIAAHSGTCFLTGMPTPSATGLTLNGIQILWPDTDWAGCDAACTNCVDPSWKCKTDKFGNTACLDPRDGTGIYNSLQDCIDDCTITQISNDSFVDHFGEVIKPWIDLEGEGCLSDIKTCQCGWDYVQNYSPPTVPTGHPPIYTQYAGASVCLSPDYALWESTLGSGTTGGSFAGLMSPFSLPCAELQGVHNPTVGMTIEGSPTTALGNYLAGSITNIIPGHPSTTYTWDKHVIVKIDPAYNSSILNPNLQVIQSTPC